ncbi:MAG: Holliday junction branch migration protein RuvA [Synechococcus sp.]|nr:Holliday junction branch migration protein RuvA [Synechococcus sp.]
MIGWLEGHVGDAWQDGNRQGLLLICGGVGYEVQVAEALLATPCGTSLAIHVHHQQRDDGSVLFGFAQKAERDLFRLLISVNGVGPQVAMGLLSSLGLEQLLQAVAHSDGAALCRAPGVGKRTAERLALEWRSRLQERWSQLGGSGVLSLVEGPAAPSELQRELTTTLEALGYGPEEMTKAIGDAAASLNAEAALEEWLRHCLAWLSRSAA